MKFIINCIALICCLLVGGFAYGSPWHQAVSYSGNCRATPAGTSCVRFEDGFIGLMYGGGVITAWEKRVEGGQTVQVVVTSNGRDYSRFQHILGTNYVCGFNVCDRINMPPPVYGAIGDKWKQLGAQSGPLGVPKTDELNAARGGRFREFQYGFIYWHPNIGAYAVYGRIGEKWNQLGRDSGPCGYPTSDEYAEGRFRRSNFQYGSILWSQQTGAQANCNPQGSSGGGCELCNDNTCQCGYGNTCANHGGVQANVGCNSEY